MAPAGTTGSSQNALATALALDSTGTLTLGGTTFRGVLVINGNAAGAPVIQLTKSGSHIWNIYNSFVTVNNLEFYDNITSAVVVSFTPAGVINATGLNIPEAGRPSADRFTTAFAILQGII